MTVVKLYEKIETTPAKSIGELADSNTIADMMGFSPVETVVRDVEGAKDKILRTGRMI